MAKLGSVTSTMMYIEPAVLEALHDSFDICDAHVHTFEESKFENKDAIQLTIRLTQSQAVYTLTLADNPKRRELVTYFDAQRTYDKKTGLWSLKTDEQGNVIPLEPIEDLVFFTVPSSKGNPAGIIADRNEAEIANKYHVYKQDTDFPEQLRLSGENL